MADIFLSYAREDATRVARLGEELVQLGWSVWRDDRIRVSAEFDDEIERQLDLAQCVIVVWSRASISSGWVRAEASAADDQGKLVPVTFESDVLPPLRFRQLNVVTVDPAGLGGPDFSEGALRLLQEIALRAGKLPHGLNPELFEVSGAISRSGTRTVTTGTWRLTTRFLFAKAWYELELHTDGTASGKGGWSVSRATDLSGRWFYDRHRQVLQLELSGGISRGMESMRIVITNWEGDYTASCTFKGRKARLERVAS